MSLQIKVILNGKVSYLPLTQSNLIIASQQGAVYTLVDESGTAVIDDLMLQRHGDKLEILVSDEPVATLDNFYVTHDNAPAYWVEGTAPPQAGALTSSDMQTLTSQSLEASSLTHHEGFTVISGHNVAIQEGIVWYAPAEMGTGAAMSSIGGVAAGLGGAGAIAVAAGASAATTATATSQSYILAVTAAAGDFISNAEVIAYDNNGNELAHGVLDSETGQATFVISNGYTGPVLVKVIDTNNAQPDYIDEATNEKVSLGTTLHAMAMANGSSNLSVSVTPLTQLAVIKAQVDTDNIALTEENVATNDAIGQLFGVEDITGAVTTVLNENYGNSSELNPSEVYGNVLAQLSGADSENGGITGTLTKLSQEIDITNGVVSITQDGVDILDDGADAFEAGANANYADLNNVIVSAPYIAEGRGGITANEASDGVIVHVEHVTVGDTVVINWGSQSQTFTATAVNADGSANFTVSSDTINNAEEGRISVSSQITSNGVTGDVSPSTIVQVNITDTANSGQSWFNTTTPTLTGVGQSNGGVTLEFTDDTNTNVSYQTTADAAGNWSVDLSQADSNGYSPVLSDNGHYEIFIEERDSSGNSPSDETQKIVIDTTAPNAVDIDATGAYSKINTTLHGESEALATIKVTYTDDHNQLITHTTTADDNGVWSIDYSVADDNGLTAVVSENKTYTVSATATDKAGNVSVAATQGATFDYVAPSAPVFTSEALQNTTIPEVSGTTEAGAKVVLTFTDDGGQALSYTTVALADGSWSVPLRIKDDNGNEATLSDSSSYDFSVVATDKAGNTSVAGEQTMSVDTSAPSAITLVSDANLITETPILVGLTEANAAVTLSFTDDNDVQVSYSTTADSNGNWSVDTASTDSNGVLAALSNGNSYTLSMIAKDTAGNSTDSSELISVDTSVADTTPPNIPTLSVSTNSDGSATVTGDAEANSIVVVTYTDGTTSTVIADNNGAYSATSAPNIPSGDISAVATDASGNASSAQSASFTDTTAPVIANVSVSNGTFAVGETATLLITTNNAETGLTLTGANFNGQTLTNITDNGDGTYNAIYTVVEGDTDIANGGSAITNLIFTDAAGNTSQAITAVVLSGESIDANSPTITITDNMAQTANISTASVTYTLSFSEVVSELESDDISVTGGTKGTLTRISDSKYQLVVTPAANSTDNIHISIASNAVIDLAGNGNAGATDSAQAVDTIAPTASVMVATDDVGSVTGELSSGDTTNDTSLVLSGTCESGSSVKVYNGTTELGDATVTGTTWSYTATVADATTYNFNIKETDSVGNESAASSDFIVTGDTTAPTPNAMVATDDVGSVTGELSSGDKTNDTSLVLSGTCESGSSVKVYNGTTELGSAIVTGTTWSYTATVADATTYNFNIKETDSTGNESAASSDFIVTGDTTAPTPSSITATDNEQGITGNLVSGGMTNDASLTLSGTCEQGSTIAIYDGITKLGNATVTGTSWSFEATVLDATHYSFSAVETDAVGNVSMQSDSFTVTGDMTAPTANQITRGRDDQGAVTGELLNNSVTDDTSIELQGSCEVGATVVVYNGTTRLGDATVDASGNWSYAATVSDSTTYQFNIKVTDAAGNESSASDNFTIIGDMSAPVFTNANGETITANAIDENTGANQVVYSASVTDANTVYYSVSGEDATEGRISINHSTGEVSLIDNPDYETKSSYSFEVKATDAAGNSQTQDVTLAINNIDDTPPTIYQHLNGEDFIFQNTESVEVNSSETGTAYWVHSSINVSSLSDITDAADNKYNAAPVTVYTNTDIALTGLIDGDYWLYATDEAGNLSPKLSGSQTPIVVDSTAPTFTSATTASINENIGEDQVVYTATATDTGSGITSYSVSGEDVTHGLITINSTSGEVTLTENPDYEDGNNTDHNYEFTVTATDAAGNSQTQDVTITVNDIADETPPVVQRVGEDSPYQNTESIAVKSSETGTAYWVHSSITPSSLSDITGAADNKYNSVGVIASTNANIALTGLIDGEYYLYATDANGNLGRQIEASPIVVDSTAPTFTSATTASVNENVGEDQIVYTAVATDNQGSNPTYTVSGEDVNSGFITINQTTGEVTLTENPDYEDVNNYEFTVTATDLAGNSTQQNVTLSVNDVDDTPPTASVVTVQGDTLYRNTEMLSVQSTETGKAYLVHEDISVTTQASITTAAATDKWNEVNITDINTDIDLALTGLVDGTYKLYTVDASGNLSNAATTQITLDTTAAAKPIKEEIDTISLGASNVSNDDNSYHQIAAVGSDGDYAITWYDASSKNICVQLFNADGSANGSVVTLEGISGGNDVAPQIASVGADGAYAVTWRSVDTQNQGSSSHTYVQLFSSDGTKNGNAVQLGGAGNNCYSPQITETGNNGAYFIAWMEFDNTNNLPDVKVYTQLFNNDGSTNGSAHVFSVVVQPPGPFIPDNISLQLASVGDDEVYAITWTQEYFFGQSSYYHCVMVGFFDTNGVKDPVIVDSSFDSGFLRDTDSPQIAAVGDHYVVTWVSEDNIKVQLFDVHGAKLNDEPVLLEGSSDVDAPFDDASPQLTALGSTGAFVVTWTSGSGVDTDIHLQLFNPDGSKNGAMKTLDGDEDGWSQVTSVGSDGAFVVVWHSDASLPSEVHSQLFNSDGTTNGDMITLKVSGAAGSGYPQVVALGSGGAYAISWTDSTTNDLHVQLFNDDGSAALRPIISLSTDSGILDTDLITNVANQTVSATLTTVLANDETLHASIDGGSSWDDVSSSVSTTNGVTTVTLNGVTLGEGSNTIQFKVVDAAGNESEVSSIDYILDTSDPIFTSSTSVSVNENIGQNQVVYTAVATDTGSGITSYSVSGEDVTQGLITIDSTSGEVTLTENPDYEDVNNYEFTVTATDKAGNSTQQNVTLNINDLDDTPPVIHSVTIPNTAMNVGDIVTVTINVDDDGNDSYTNLSGTVGGYSLTNLNRVDSTTYTAKFTITDSGTDVAAGSDIPVSLTLDDSAGNTSVAYTTSISQDSDAIDANRPSLQSMTPADGATSTSISDNLTITFDENVVAGTGNITIYKSSDDSIVDAINVTDNQVTGWGGTTLTVDPSNDLDNGTEYYVKFDDGAILDNAGNSASAISNTTDWNFTTEAGGPANEPQNDVVVTFDLTGEGEVTSSDNNLTVDNGFDSTKTYIIQIVVDTKSNNLVNPGSRISGGSALGNDDYYVVVGNDSTMHPKGFNNQIYNAAKDTMYSGSTYMAWIDEANGVVAGLQANNGRFTRNGPVIELWDGYAQWTNNMVDHMLYQQTINADYV